MVAPNIRARAENQAASAVSLFQATFAYSELPRQQFHVPAITADAIDRIEIIVRIRGDLHARVVRILVAASFIPPASRRRRVLQALAGWIPDVPASVRSGEQWFDRRVVRAVAGAAGCAPSTVAAWLARLCLEI